MSETKIKRPKLSAEDPAGALGVPLLHPNKDWGVVPQKYKGITESGAAEYECALFGNVINHFKTWYVYPKFGDKLHFDTTGDDWILGWGEHKPQEKIYLFPQNDNEELVGDELDRLDKKDEARLDINVEYNKLKETLERIQKEKRFKLICALAPAVYEATDKRVNSKLTEPKNGWSKEMAKEVLKAADAILEAEGE